MDEVIEALTKMSEFSLKNDERLLEVIKAVIHKVNSLEHRIEELELKEINVKEIN